MWLVTRITGKALGVISSYNLREGSGLGAVRLMAAAAYDSGVQLRRLDVRGIVRMLGLRTMAGFARHNDVLSLFLLIDDVCVTAFANFVSRMSNGPCGNLGDGRSPVMAVLPETLRHHRSSQNQENTD